ncbi:unnamed protein product [Ectocarpus sp. CCAP 1310/34]|nr:unnamed protein product [Ectocarpus sp. CCAP 1310/34]
MNEASLLRALRQYRKVRGPDFHQPATRSNQGKIENGDGGVEKRQPLTKEERAHAEKALAAAAAAGGGGVESAHTQQALPESDTGAGADADNTRPDLIDPVDFWKEFDAWVDAKYPGDRGSSTKVKVAFRKQHRAFVSKLNLEDIEEIAQAMQ